MKDLSAPLTTSAAVPAAGESPAYLAYGQVAEEINACLRAGRPPDVEALAARHPELGSQVRELAGALVALQQLGPEGPASADAGAPAALGQLGDYRIRREAGRGGMGVVYEAEQVSLGRRVALKVLPFAAALDPRQLARFRVEAQAAAQLHHTNIVPVFSVGVERGVHYYAMQFIDGRSLAEVIRELAPLHHPGPHAEDRTDRDGSVAEPAGASARGATSEIPTFGKTP